MRKDVVGPDGHRTSFVLETDIDLEPPHWEEDYPDWQYMLVMIILQLMELNGSDEAVFPDVGIKATRRIANGKCIIKFDRRSIH